MAAVGPAVLRAVVWAALVLGCALPLLTTMWDKLDPTGRVGAALGVVIWAAAMPFLETRLRLRNPSHIQRLLMVSAGVFFALELIGMLAFQKWFLFVLFTPSVLVSAQLPFFRGASSDFGPSLALTLICGGQALAIVLSLRWMITFVMHRYLYPPLGGGKLI